MSKKSDIFYQLGQMIIPQSIRIIGLGNIDRADDGAGLLVVSRLKQKFPTIAFDEREKSVEGLVIQFSEDPSIDFVLFLDASDFNGIPGEIRLFKGGDLLKISPVFSTHKAPISMLISILQEAGKVACLLAVQQKTLEFLGPMSHPVVQAVEQMVQRLQIILDGNNI